MNKSYFCSERVRLRAMEPEDLEVMYAMENDSQTWDVTNFTVPYSRFVLKQYIENSECDMFADRQLRMMIIRVEDDAVIGTIDITEFSPMHARGEVGIAIRKEYQGNGYAKEALRLLCDYVFSFLYLKQLIVHISVDNEASIRLFESCGFVRCGLLKEWWRVEDAIRMSCCCNFSEALIERWNLRETRPYFIFCSQLAQCLLPECAAGRLVH